MQIEHIALWTNDPERMKRFYTEIFQGKANTRYHNPRTGFSSYFITFQSGSRLEIMSIPDLLSINDNTATATGYAHIAFSVGSQENVVLLTNQIREKGYPILREPRWTGDSYFESCVADPDGNRVEITV
jgi:lactoylglutathione lyase